MISDPSDQVTMSVAIVVMINNTALLINQNEGLDSHHSNESTAQVFACPSYGDEDTSGVVQVRQLSTGCLWK